MTIEQVCAVFNGGEKYVECKDVGTGNINNTYYVKCLGEKGESEYIIQRINKSIFTKPDKLMDNIVRVTEHIHGNVVKDGLSTRKFVVHVFNSTEDGKPFVIDENGDYWRCYRCIHNAVTFDASDDLGVIREVGSAFGKFQNWLDGFDANSLYIVIPDFHNTPKRFEALKNAIASDPLGRVKEVKREIEKILSFSEPAGKLQSMLDSGAMPIRVTHNDTKCNNVSFDKDTKKALAVLDLDTVMPGAVAYDFGDAIRSIASTVIEDDPDISKVALDMDKFEAFTEGFVPQVKDCLTKEERETLNYGPFAMTIELAVRFLTDYILGDVYFKTKYPGHNLDRARNQLALAIDMSEKKEKTQKIIEKYLGK